MHNLQPATIAYRNITQANAQASVTALHNIYEGDTSARQLSETIAEFLARCPPLTTHISTHGPWIYLSNPHSTVRHTTEDRAGFITKGHRILEDFRTLKAGTETSMAKKSKAVTTRTLTPHRDKLEFDLLSAAKETDCTSGKWMLFPKPSHVNSSWSLVATATAKGELGHAAKVATDEGDPNKARLICVYTENFGDKGDVKRVLEKLLDLGLAKRNGALAEGIVIYYKSDAYTYLDIMGGNEYGLKASMFSSRDILSGGGGK